MGRQLKPCGNRAILKRIDDKRTRGGVMTGSLTDEKPQECVVVVPPIVTDSMALAMGDHVFIPKAGVGWEITVDGETFVVIDADGILVQVMNEGAQD